MAYRSLGIGCKGYIIEQPLLDWQFVYICRNCQAATGTVRSISQIERGAAKNEADEREREGVGDVWEGQNQFSGQDSVSSRYLEHAGLQLPRSAQQLSVQTCRMFFTPWSLPDLICKKTEKCVGLNPTLPPSRIGALFSLQHCSALIVYNIFTRKFYFIIIGQGSSCWDHSLF